MIVHRPKRPAPGHEATACPNWPCPHTESRKAVGPPGCVVATYVLQIPVASRLSQLGPVTAGPTTAGVAESEAGVEPPSVAGAAAELESSLQPARRSASVVAPRQRKNEVRMGQLNH